jgi:indole-3-glycerol phosphate synthase
MNGRATEESTLKGAERGGRPAGGGTRSPGTGGVGVAAFVETGTVLDRILARTAADVAIRKAATSLGVLREMAAGRPAPVSLRRALAGPGVAVIAEIKRGSPSRGTFPVAVDPPVVAAAYLQGGAAALSVLTDAPYFQGSLVDLRAASIIAHARPTPAPVLRKDFMLDPWQVHEAFAHGADAILLIVAALEDDALAALREEATMLGMDALVEVHDETELERALALGTDLIGVNNRDLRTFAVDLATTERLAARIPADRSAGIALVAESGVFSRADVERLGQAGAAAVLVGEGLIVQPDRAAAVRALLGEANET